MGQYHKLVNLDKHEFVNPHRIGDGLKLWEMSASSYGIGSALVILLAASNGRGGGDFNAPDKDGIIGRWAGDRIAFIGDYGEDNDLPAEFEAGTLYSKLEENNSDWVDISESLKPILQYEFEVSFKKTSYDYCQRSGGIQ